MYTGKCDCLGVEIHMEFSMIQRLPFFPNKHRICRGLACLKESFLGLDFSMPDRMYDRKRNDGAMYVVTPKNTLKEAFDCVDLKKYPRIIDIGCGKGYVLWQAKKYGFAKIGGIEYDEKLWKICVRNMKRLGIDRDVTVAHEDARTFSGYGNYDVFYFFNPFVEEVMNQVIGQIIEQCKGRQIMIIYYRPRYTDWIEGCGYFQKICTFEDSAKGYSANIYQGRIPE